MQKQSMRMEIKEISNEGKFTGLLSVYNVVDLVGDIVEPGAFTKTLSEHGNQVPLLWQHKTDEPIGTLTLSDTPTALQVDGQLLMELSEARKAYLLIKARIVKGLSIGFDTIKEQMDGTIRRLKECRLWEGSIVTFPACEQAQITSVKQRREIKDTFSTEFAERMLQETTYQMYVGLKYALGSIPWAPAMTREEKLAASAASLTQFSDAYLTYLPSYLDWLAEEYKENEIMDHKSATEEKGGKTKRVDDVDLPASCFAYVGDESKTETWKLPIEFPGDEAKTKSHIGDALSRFNQTEDIPDGEKPKVLAKIKAAAKSHGIDKSDDSGKSAPAPEHTVYVRVDEKQLEETVNRIIGEAETKAGRRLSAATKGRVMKAMRHVEDAGDSMDEANGCFKSAHKAMRACKDAYEDPNAVMGHLEKAMGHMTKGYDCMSDAGMCYKNAHKMLGSLTEDYGESANDEALVGDPDAGKSKAEPEIKSEPDEDAKAKAEAEPFHSAAQILDELKALFPAA